MINTIPVEYTLMDWVNGVALPPQSGEKVRNAKIRDLTQILEIQEQYKIEDCKDFHKGFITHPIGGEELKLFLSDKGKYLWVYDGGNGVEGYLAAYDKLVWFSIDNKITRATNMDESTRKILSGPFIYGRHIVKKSGANTIVPISLENHFFELAIKEGYNHAFSEISLLPFNERSFRFNQQIGWKQVGETEEETSQGKVIWALMHKELKSGNSSK